MSKKPDINNLVEGITIATDGKIVMYAGEEEKTVAGVTYEFSHGDVHEMFRGHKLEFNEASIEEITLGHSLGICVGSEESFNTVELGVAGVAIDVSCVGVAAHGAQAYFYGALHESALYDAEAKAQKNEITGLWQGIAATNQSICGACNELFGTHVDTAGEAIQGLGNKIKTVAQATNVVGTQVATIASKVDMAADHTEVVANQTMMNTVNSSLATLTTII